MNNYIILNKKITENKVRFLTLLFNFYENFWLNQSGRLVRTLNYWRKNINE